MNRSRREVLQSFAGAAAGTLEAKPLLEKVDVFEAGKDGYEIYRIPGIVVTRKGTVLAFCEARKSSRGDWGTIDIMLRRSNDGGRIWSPRQKIADVTGPHAKNPVAMAQKLATPDERTYNNPTAIVDRDGTVHFLFCLEYMRCFYMRSTDEGKTFSAPIEITATFGKFRPEYDWKVLATGPGHGIQMRSGRLVVPIWMATGTGGHAHRPSVASVVFSDDHGKTWRRGDIAVQNTPQHVFPSETVAEELADGRVMLNVRSESKDHRRILVYSKDGATGWSAPRFHPQLLEPICMASMVRFSTARGRGRNRLLFSNPDNLERRDGKAAPGVNRDRRNLSVKLSYDEGKAWPVSKTLEAGWSGYSDLAVTKDGMALCFYERGGRDDKAFRTAALSIARFNLDWLTDGKDAGTGKAK